MTKNLRLSKKNYALGMDYRNLLFNATSLIVQSTNYSNVLELFFSNIKIQIVGNLDCLKLINNLIYLNLHFLTRRWSSG